MAPEILNWGHDRAVDLWLLGVLMWELLMGHPPFIGSDPMKIYNVILRGIDLIHFLRYITKAAISIIKRFCKENSTERLGYQKEGIENIRRHGWFLGFDWDGLESRSLPAPHTPKLKNRTGASNFDKYPRDKDTSPDELSGWDESF